ncbi:MAG: heavy metal translocating P-type ATPase [Nitrospirota bacterium]
MLTCDHCLLPMDERDAVHVNVDGAPKVFCCHGCSGVYQLIHSEGLDDFYARRRAWVPGPAALHSVDAASFSETLRKAGDEIETDLVLDGIRCASCVWLNERVLLRTPGVTYAKVNYATHRARVRWNPAEADFRTILARITSIGYIPKPFLPKAFKESQDREGRDLLIRFGTAAFFSMQLMLFSIALYAGYFQGIEKGTKDLFHVISLVLTTPVLFYSGWPIFQGAFRGLRNRSFTMDVLIAAGAFAAYGYSLWQMLQGGEVYFDTSAMIITLILLGRYIETGAKRRASETIGRLMQLVPRQARVLTVDPGGHAGPDAMHHAERTMVPVGSVRPGDLLEVVPGEKFPLDGIVVDGRSEADESMLTGESRPNAKEPGSAVFGGTVNLYGSVVFQVTRKGKDTVLSQIINAVEEAQARRAPIQAVADRVVGIFVPVVLIIAALTFAGWLLQGASTASAVMSSVSVLVIACPCALGLATPLAILIGTSHGASRGVLIKGGDVIEQAAKIDLVVLDKTGTLTEGRPVVNAYFGVGMSDAGALRLAASLERRSEHSLGKAIAEAGKSAGMLDVAEFSAVPGKGVRGKVDGVDTYAGNRAYIESEGLKRSMEGMLAPAVAERVIALERSGCTLVYLCRNGAVIGVFAIADRIRPEAERTVSLLRGDGLEVAMVTGDTAPTAAAVAAATGITRVKSQVTPVGKAAEIRLLAGEGRTVMMVGDGINDAPALVEAAVGTAMGRATDIALESSGLVILRPDLALVPEAIALAKKTFSVIRQNLFWAFFYNIVMIPVAAAGLLHPVMAAAAMAFSSLTVVGNSLRAKTP